MLSNSSADPLFCLVSVWKFSVVVFVFSVCLFQVFISPDHCDPLGIFPFFPCSLFSYCLLRVVSEIYPLVFASKNPKTPTRVLQPGIFERRMASLDAWEIGSPMTPLPAEVTGKLSREVLPAPAVWRVGCRF